MNKMMKKQLLLVAALFLGVATFAQTANSLQSDEASTPIDTEQENSILSRGTERGELVLTVGSQQITLGSASSNQRVEGNSTVKVKNNRIAFGLSSFELGYSLLTSIDYGGFPPEEQGFMDQRIGKSFHVGWRVLELEVGLNRSRSVNFVTGISVSFDNYRFDPAWSLEKVDGVIRPVALEAGKKKSKMATTAIGLPVGLKFRPSRKVELSLFGYAELITNARTKVKKPKVKNELHGLNDVRFGVEAAATWKNIGIYYKHSFTPLFESGVGPKCYPISVGIAWGF